MVIEGLNVNGLTPVEGSGFTKLDAEDMAFIPRRVSVYLTEGEAKQFRVGQSISLTLLDATSAGTVDKK